jgi:acyl-CoA thioester hydrolase
MITSKTKLRVRYGETDQMGYAYYGVYAQYYEVGRVDALRAMGLSYKEFEERGVMLPVIEMNINYKKPAYYDDELTIVTYLKEIPKSVRITFDYECYNQNNELINTGKVILVCVDKVTNKLCRFPQWYMDIITPYFNKSI